MSRYRLQRVDASSRDLAWLDAECFPDDAPCLKPGGAWWIARAKGVGPVAFAGIRYWEADGCGYLCRAGVVPGHRGHGLQRRLIHARVAYAKEQKWDGVYTYTAGDNLPSANNLIACGFRLWEPSYEWGVSGSLYWWLPLGGAGSASP